MFQDQVFCFTPKGDLIALPQAATPVDFAYAVHSEIGDHCASAKINGRTGWNMHRVLEELSGSNAGVVIILGQDYVSNSMQGMIDEYFSGKRRPVTMSGPAYRNIGTGSQILRELGVRRMRLLSSPMRFNALSGFDLEIVEYIEAP